MKTHLPCPEGSLVSQEQSSRLSFEFPKNFPKGSRLYVGMYKPKDTTGYTHVYFTHIGQPDDIPNPFKYGRLIDDDVKESNKDANPWRFVFYAWMAIGILMSPLLLIPAMFILPLLALGWVYDKVLRRT